MDDLKKALDQVRGETRQTFARVRATIREQYDAVGSALEKQQAAIARQGEAIKRLEIARTQHHAAIVELQTSVAGLGKSVAGLETSVAGLETSVAGLQTSEEGTRGSIRELQRANAFLHDAHIDTRRSLARQTHVLDQTLSQAAEDFDRHSESVGKVIYTYVDDLHALKAEVQGISSRVDALERTTPPAA